MKCRQAKFCISILFLIFVGIFYCEAEIPNSNIAKKKLRDLHLFEQNRLDAMCDMHKNENGFFYWSGAFQEIYNSTLSYEEQLSPLIYLLILGINQITLKDKVLINIIKENLECLTKEDEKTLKEKGPCSFEELKEAFEARSNPSSPVYTDEEFSE